MFGRQPVIHRNCGDLGGIQVADGSTANVVEDQDRQVNLRFDRKPGTSVVALKPTLRSRIA
jgi:hypothetical protein